MITPQRLAQPRDGLARLVLDALRAWWSMDRIRASPGDGRLYRLRPGWIVRVGDRVGEVETIDRGASEPAVEAARTAYRCRDATGHVFVLRVTQLRPAAPPIVEWDGGGGGAHRLDADHVIVLPVRPPNATRAHACVV